MTEQQLLKAIERHNPKLSVALAWSIPLELELDRLDRTLGTTLLANKIREEKN